MYKILNCIDSFISSGDLFFYLQFFCSTDVAVGFVGLIFKRQQNELDKIKV